MALKFKEGDIVYHKASLKRGVISAKGVGRDWLVVWKNLKERKHNEIELWSEEEYKKIYPKPKGRQSGGR